MPTHKKPKGYHRPENKQALRIYMDARNAAVVEYNSGLQQLREVYFELKKECANNDHNNALWVRYCRWKKALRERMRTKMKASDATWLLMTGERA